MTVADTSFLVCFFDADDRRHAVARNSLANTNPLIVGPEVLVETLGVLKAKAGRRTADQALDDLMNLKNVEWGRDSDIAATYRIYCEEDALSFVDAAVVELCVRRNLEPLTFDERQTKAVQRRIAGKKV